MSMLEVRSISKRFGPVRANDGVDLTIPPGSLHAVLGENGAGKSTLMKILSGFQDADAGTVLLDGAPLRLGSPRAAIGAGIGMLHQDPLVALPMTVLENFLFGRAQAIGRVEARRTLTEIADRLGFRLDPDRITRSLTVGERQQLEIVRLLSLGVKVLILDEPTSGITTDQRDELFAALRTLAGDGMIVLFVSHKLEEVADLCESVTVMRHGRVTGSVDLPCPPETLVEMMFGQAVSPTPRPPHDIGKMVAGLRGITAESGRQRIEDVTLQIHRGEVVGVAGLEGSGQLPLLRVMAGLDRPLEGSIELGDRHMETTSHRDHLRAGIHFIPAGRLEEGLFPGLTIEEHLTLAASVRERGLDPARDRARAVSAIDALKIKGEPASVIEGLSGGNQQRVLLSMMPDAVSLLLMEQPTRGLDIDSADLVWTQILRRCDEGTGILFASSDLDELLRYSDRIAVCFDGRIIATLPAHELDSDRLGALIGGSIG